MDSPRQITDILTVTQAPVLALEDHPSKSFGHEETFGSEAESAGLGFLKPDSSGPSQS